MIKVNLVPADILAKADQKQRSLQAVVAAAAVLVVVALVSAGHVFKLNRLKAQLDKDNQELKRLELIVAKVEELERTAAALRSRLGVITDLIKGRTLYPYFMADFVRSVPVGVRVKNMQTAGGGSTLGPMKLTMAAEARSNEDIAAWVKKMEDSGRFSNAELGAVMGSTAGEKIYSFTMTAVYTPAL